MTVATWIENFKINFPEFKEFKNGEGTDITDTVLTYYLFLAMDLLPQGAIEYFTQDRLAKVVDYMVAHLLQYYDILNSYDSTKSLMRTTSSMSANGLSISYSEVTKLRGEMFPTLNDWLNTTAYGKSVTVFLNQLAGSVGGYVV
jgi:hypothetical protein